MTVGEHAASFILGSGRSPWGLTPGPSPTGRGGETKLVAQPRGEGRFVSGAQHRRTASVLLPALTLLACSADSARSSPVIEPHDAAPDTILLDSSIPDGSITCEGQVVLPGDDWDQDGWSIKQGDCNDCDRNANPGAFDVPGNGVDEDCTGEPDDEPSACDAAVELTANDALDAARALGLCRFTSPNPVAAKRTWGVIEARWEQADGTAGMHYASHGALPDFGPYVPPQQGASLLVLSTGAARRPGDEAYQSPQDANMGTSCATPPGWPKDAPSCPTPQSSAPIANDSASLVLRLRVPTNALSFSFRLAFYTAEFPDYVCNQYNDFFVALLDSQAASPKAQDGNICFDELGNPIGVNSALLRACLPQVAGGKGFDCPLGNEPLVGTGFDVSTDEPRGHASTGWLQTQAAVQPGEELTLRFAIWDGGDHLRTSTVLLDAFQWEALPAKDPQTVPVPK
jgi:hypothetical protein